MSDYCSMTFVATPVTKAAVETYINTLFDATRISFVSNYDTAYNTYQLVIGELTLKECIGILNKIKAKFKTIQFVIDYGVY